MGTLCPNWGFTAENKMWNSQLVNFKLNMMNEVFHFLKFQEFISELEKNMFAIGKNEILNLLDILRTLQNFDLWKSP